MKKIYIIGDMHTVSAFRLSGVTGMVSTRENARLRLEEAVMKRDAGMVIITSGLSGDLRERIAEINLGMASPVIIEIPGIDDREGFPGSVVDYIAEALGIAL